MPLIHWERLRSRLPRPCSPQTSRAPPRWKSCIFTSQKCTPPFNCQPKDHLLRKSIGLGETNWNLEEHTGGWKKSQTTTWDVWNPANNGIFTISTGAGFCPSTVGKLARTLHSTTTVHFLVPAPSSSLWTTEDASTLPLSENPSRNQLNYNAQKATTFQKSYFSETSFMWKNASIIINPWIHGLASMASMDAKSLLSPSNSIDPTIIIDDLKGTFQISTMGKTSGDQPRRKKHPRDGRKERIVSKREQTWYIQQISM